jgi:uncharacterized protein
MPRKRIVVDTGVIISASLWGGEPAKALDKAIDEGTLLFTNDTMRELIRVLAYEKFDAVLSNESRRAIAYDLASRADFVTVLEAIQECEDPNDNIILEAAFYGKADFVIASDKKINKMHPFRQIPIYSPAQYARK